MKRVILCSMLLWIITLVPHSLAQDRSKKVVSVLPFEAIDVPSSDAIKLTQEITLGFASVPEVETTPFDKVQNAFKDTSVIKESTCKNRVCLLTIGRRLQSEIIFTGSLYKIDKRFSFSLIAIDCRDNTTLWSKDYSCDCEFKDFLKKTSNAAVSDSRYALFLGENATDSFSDSTQKEESSPVDSSITTDSSDSENTDESENESENTENKSIDNGTVKGITIGFNGRAVIGGTEREESEWSAETMVLFPTSSHSHLRTRVSLPSSTSKDMLRNSTCDKDNDLLFSVDHEWGFKKIGITFGAAYMFMKAFTKEFDGREYSFDDFNLFSWVLGIRAGTPNHGFRGRICYPMPFVLNYGKSEQNTFVEYSAFGMFGSDKVKAGVGIQGVYKRRFSDGSSAPSNYTYDYSYNYNYNYGDYKESVQEFYFMAPSGKVSFLAGTHSVVTLGLDFMGLMIPDVFNRDDGWTPSVYVGYTLSLEPLKRVDSFDGKF